MKQKKQLLAVMLILLFLMFFGCIEKKIVKPNLQEKKFNENTEKNSAEKPFQALKEQEHVEKINDLNSNQRTDLNKQDSALIIDSSNLPKFVEKNFIELEKIKQISKFRSGYGHDFSFGSKESCRSMKHYFWLKGEDYFWLQHHENEISAESWMKVKYFSPVNGVIFDLRSNDDGYGGIESQLIIRSQQYPEILFLFFHVRLKKGLQLGSKLTAGEFIGFTGVGSHGEIAVSIETKNTTNLVSYFSLLKEKVFREYQEKGIKDINDLIITKEERDKNPLICEQDEIGKFIGSKTISSKKEFDAWSMSKDNWVFLN